jgi:SpoVK/Ycf46/Vps4 family AAA+-type ATPase
MECHDTFGVYRDAPNHSVETRLLLTAFLAALDGLVATPGPIVIASSNRPPFLMDKAIVRAGRLGYKVRFTLPDDEERAALFLSVGRQWA